MTKTKAERARYCRQWRKRTYDQKRFNKVVREYVEARHTDIMKECTSFYEALTLAHPESKDLTKSKMFKLWKKEQQSNQESPEPQPRQESPEPQSNQESPEPQSNQESPEPQSNQESPEPQPNQESPEPQPRQESPEPQSNQESPEPQSNQESPEPQSNQESPEPQSRQESPEPQPRQESPEPFRNDQNILDQAIEEFSIEQIGRHIDQLDRHVQNMIDELQRDPEIRNLLNNEELFPPLQEDEGIAMDIEVETDDVYDPLLEEVFW